MKKGLFYFRRMVWPGIMLAMVLALVLVGCGLNDGEEKDRTDLDFTVVEQDEIPAELKKVIENHKEEEMQVAYIDQGSLYAVRGYGKQNSGGYSIAVDECSEGKEKIYVATTLIGPSETDNTQKDPSYPVVVLKLENRDKEVVFE